MLILRDKLIGNYFENYCTNTTGGYAHANGGNLFLDQL